MDYNTITFYKFIEITDPEGLMNQLRNLCEVLNVKGRILLGKEGINGGVSGTKPDIHKLKLEIMKRPQFNDLTFRELETETNSYHRLVVRIRDEIITLGKQVDMRNKANYITPENLKKLYDEGEDFVILDTRNKYEADVGKFKNAIVLPIDSFYDFPQAINTLADIKNKKIITYCTGGIRCEKATAFMNQIGFENVFQLKGGIIEFVNTFPGEEFEGDLFVFDDRLVSKTGSDKKLGKCEICLQPCNNYTDCYNMDCDKLFICCDDCKIKMKNTCCEECKVAERHRPILTKL
ncbi:MAG TPA: rhodanese-related sulfurtransferase [Candidatus Nanoarchaeia archaeon]|nr:rhodanese-related sulfurtransferase [Candidatus Nanoarchaeia archaeon]